MRRALLISLSLILVLVDWSTVGAGDSFYVIPAMRGKYAPLPKTGQTTSYDTEGRDDGALQKGVAWPTPRFTDNTNGTVTDNLTGMIWMQNANVLGAKTWTQALNTANNLKSGDYNLTDGSQPGDWRLPNLREFQSLVDYGRRAPALPADNHFAGVQVVFNYWSSTTALVNDTTTSAWTVLFAEGTAEAVDKAATSLVWCVRGGP